MTKIKELLSNREKLAKYEEMTEWKEIFADEDVSLYIDSPYFDFGECNFTLKDVPDHIKQIIVSALEAEIKKLDEE